MEKHQPGPPKKKTEWGPPILIGCAVAGLLIGGLVIGAIVNFFISYR